MIHISPTLLPAFEGEGPWIRTLQKHLKEPNKDQSSKISLYLVERAFQKKANFLGLLAAGYDGAFLAAKKIRKSRTKSMYFPLLYPWSHLEIDPAQKLAADVVELILDRDGNAQDVLDISNSKEPRNALREVMDMATGTHNLPYGR